MKRNFIHGICIDCEVYKPIVAKGRCANCKAKHWRSENLERSKEIRKNSFKRTRTLVLSHYGNRCVCCGEKQNEFLAMDHINNNGNEHRREIKTHAFYSWIKNNNYPNDLQILCHNCNLAKGFYGICPHQQQ